MKPLCRDDCMGLCSQCGKDRHKEPCTCAEGTEGSPFESLKYFVGSKR
jgi:uncharacterized protein